MVFSSPLTSLILAASDSAKLATHAGARPAREDSMTQQDERGACSRRNFLRASAAASVGGPLALAAPARAAEAAAALEPFTVAEARFSKAERDRRWAAVRAIMARP